MSLKTLVNSIERKEVLLPVLRAFLRRHYEDEASGKISRKAGVVADSLLAIETFQERIEEFNHGEVTGEYFHPSRLGACLRALYFEAKGAPKNQGADSDDIFRTHMIFETGTYVGVLFANLCARAGVLVQREVAIQDPVRKILGHVDIEVKVDGQKYPVEVKTINSRQFTMLTQPHESHKRQLHAYMKSRGYKWGIVIYLEKDRHQAKEFLVEFDEKFYRQFVAERIEKHFTGLRRNILPDREGAGPNEFPCRFCAFTTVCFGSTNLAAWMRKLSLVRVKVNVKTSFAPPRVRDIE